MMKEPLWRVATAGSLANSIQTTTLWTLVTVLVPIWVSKLGGNSANLLWAAIPSVISRLVLALVLVPASVIVEKLGPAQAMRVGVVVVALGLLVLAWKGQSLLHLAIAQIAIAACGALTGLPIYTVLVLVWLLSNDASILARVSASFDLAQAVSAPIIALLCSYFGWRMTLSIFGLLLIFVVLPLSLVGLEDPSVPSRATSPSVHGIDPELPAGGTSPRDDAEHPVENEDVMSDSGDTVIFIDDSEEVQLWQTQEFWILATSTVLGHMAIGGLQEGIIFFLVHDRAWSLFTASAPLFLMQAAMAMSKLVMGNYTEHHASIETAMLTAVLRVTQLSFVGTVLLLFQSIHVGFLIPSVCCAGAAFGTSCFGRQFLVPRLFEHSLGHIYSLLFELELVAHAVGSFLCSALRIGYVHTYSSSCSFGNLIGSALFLTCFT
mmetsp:Transcript_12650/g.25656  ORF Transcript_12650/g.25656 Transcript_12650/m.25656 type:complete len:435 (-) Transcript_12650:3376-4680(-)